MKTKRALKIFSTLILIISFASLIPTVVLAAESRAVTERVSSFLGRINRGVVKKYLQLVPGNKNGKLVLQQAAWASEGLETVVMEISLDSVLLSDNDQVGGFNFVLEGPFKINSSVGDKLEQEMSMSGKLNVEGTTYSFDWDYKLDGRDMYVRINLLPAIPLIDSSQLMDQWLYFELSDHEQKLDEPGLSRQQEEQVMRAVTDLIETAEVSKAKKTELRGQKVFAIDVSFAKSDLIDFLLRIDQIINEDEQNIDRLDREDLEEAFSYMSTPELSFAVNRKNFYFSHLGLRIDFQTQDPLQKKQQLQALESQGSMLGILSADQLEISADVYLSDFNQPIEFTVPESYEDGQQKIQESLQINTMSPGMMDGQNPGYSFDSWPDSSEQSSSMPFPERNDFSGGGDSPAEETLLYQEMQQMQ